MGGRKDGRMEVWMDGWTDRWTDGRMEGWVDGRVGGWMDGRVDGCTNGDRVDEVRVGHVQQVEYGAVLVSRVRSVDDERSRGFM